MMQRMCSATETAKLQTWMALSANQRDPRGRKRFWKKFESVDTGCRLGKDGGKKKTYVSPFEAEESQLKAWARHADEQGDELSPDDLVDKFNLILYSQLWELEEKQEMHGCLSQADIKKLDCLKARLANLDNRKNKSYLKARLQYVCNFVPRRPHNVVPFTGAENDCICKLSWQS